MRNWQELLDAAGLTQRELAALIEYGEGAVSDLVKKDKAGPKLRRAARRALEARIAASRSEVSPGQKPETSGVELQEAKPEYLTVEEWKHRYRSLERENERLKKVIRIMAAPSLSSKTDADAEEAGGVVDDLPLDDSKP